jgi:carbon monoxide dehydrogenase subunit G
MHRAETTIERSADDVWAVIGDFGDQRWFPGVERLELVGDERTTWMQGIAPGNVERLEHHDDAARTYTYATVRVVGDPVVPTAGGGSFDTSTLIGRHRATITVTPVGATSCHVTYDVTVDDNDAIAAAISQGYLGVLASLKAQLET